MTDELILDLQSQIAEMKANITTDPEPLYEKFNLVKQQYNQFMFQKQQEEYEQNI